MRKLDSYDSERIYWAVEQVEQEAGDIDTLHLDDSLFYLKSEADNVIAEKDKMIAELKDSVGKLLKSTRKLLNAKTEQVMDEVFQKCLIYGEGFVPVEHAARLAAELVNLRRELWLTRARRAEARKNYWYVRSMHEGDTDLWSIDGTACKNIGCIKKTNYEWLLTWSEVESKCRAKAEVNRCAH